MELLENRLKTMECTMTELSATHEETKRLCQTHEQIVVDRVAAVNELESQNDALKAQLASIDLNAQALEDLEAEGATAKRRMAALEADLTQAAQERVALLAKLDNRDIRLAELEILAAEALKLRNAVKEKEDISRGLEEQTAEVARLLEQLSSVRESALLLTHEKDSLRSQLAESEAQVAQLLEKLAAAERVEVLLEEREQEILSLERQLQSQAVENATTSALINKKQATVTRLENEVAAWGDQLAAKAEELARLQTTLIALQDDNARIGQMHASQLTRFQELSDSNDGKQKRIEHLEQELSIRRGRMADLEGRKEEKIREVEHELTVERDVAGQLRQEVGHLQQELGHLKELVMRKDETIAHLEKDLMQLRSDAQFAQQAKIGSDDLIQSLREECACLEAERDSAQSDGTQVAAELDSVREHVKRLEAELLDKCRATSDVGTIAHTEVSSVGLAEIVEERNNLRGEVQALRAHIAALEMVRRRSVASEGRRRVVPPDPATAESVSPTTVTPPRFKRRDSATSTATDRLQHPANTELEELVTNLSLQLTAAERTIRKEQEASKEAANVNAIMTAQLQALKDRVERQVAEIAELAFEVNRANKEVEEAKSEAREARIRLVEMERAGKAVRKETAKEVGGRGKPLPSPPSSFRKTNASRHSMNDGTGPIALIGRLSEDVDETVAPMIDIDLMPSLLYEELTTQPERNGGTALQGIPGYMLLDAKSPGYFADLAQGRQAQRKLIEKSPPERYMDDEFKALSPLDNIPGQSQTPATPPNPTTLTRFSGTERSRIHDLERQLLHLKAKQDSEDHNAPMCVHNRVISTKSSVDVGTQVNKKKSFWKKITTGNFRNMDNDS